MNQVRFWFGLIVCVLCCTLGVAHADIMTWAAYREAYEKEWFQIYVHGVGDGLVMANAQRLADHEKPLFCVPGILRLTEDTYRQMLDDHLKAMIKKPDREPIPNVFVEAELLHALLGAFPCEKR
jgi:hypothetical protein